MTRRVSVALAIASAFVLLTLGFTVGQATARSAADPIPAPLASVFDQPGRDSIGARFPVLDSKGKTGLRLTGAPVSSEDSDRRPLTAQPSPPDGVAVGPQLAVRGLATWYCGNGSPCTRGTRPGELVAAAGSELRTGDWRGRIVRVASGSRAVVVRLVDSCACPGPRIIDLSRAAFAKLADPSRGVIAVTVGPVHLPATDR